MAQGPTEEVPSTLDIDSIEETAKAKILREEIQGREESERKEI